MKRENSEDDFGRQLKNQGDFGEYSGGEKWKIWFLV